MLSKIDSESYAKKLSKFANFLICSDNGEDIGFIAYYENNVRNELYITLIAVKQGLQHQGIGSELLYQLESKYKDSSINSIELEVDKTNTNAHKFYLNHGFKEIEDRFK